MNFSDWISLESYIDSIFGELAKKRALAETFSLVFGLLDELPLREGSESESERNGDLRTILRSLRTIRNASIKKRAENVEFLKKVHEEIKKAERDENYVSKLDVDDAIPVLVKMGYIKKDQVESMEIDEIEKEIERASKETGNDAISLKDGESEKASEELAEAMMKVYSRKLNNLAWAKGNQQRVGDKVGHQFYSPEDLMSEMYAKIMKMVSKRKWSKGKLLDWGQGSKIHDMIDSEGDFDPDHMYAYFAKMANTSASSMRISIGRSLDPSSRGIVASDIHSNKESKASIINKDIKSMDFSSDNIYRRYLKEISDTPFGTRSPEENIISHDNEDDRLRVNIMKAIEYEYETRPSSRSYLSLDPEKIKETLENYLTYYLKNKEKRAIHASTLMGDNESSDDEILSGVQAAFHHSDDDVASSPSDPWNTNAAISSRQTSNAQKIIFDFFKPYMAEAINEISAESIVTAKGNAGANEALALCIKFNIPCSVSTMVWEKVNKLTGEIEREVIPKHVMAQKTTPNLSQEIKDYFQSMIGEKKSWSWGDFCKEAFNKYGLDGRRISALWSTYPTYVDNQGRTDPKGEKLSPRGYTSMDAYIYGARGRTEGALSKMCRKMQEMMPPWATEPR